MSEVKPFLAVLVGAVCLVSVSRIEANSGVPAHVTVLSAEDAAGIHGSTCPVVPLLYESVCHGNSTAGTCTSSYWSCPSRVCGDDCSFQVSKRSTPGPWWDIRTRPCVASQESPPKQCTATQATGQRGTCTVPFNPFSNCYCSSPPTTVNCAGNATFTEFASCN